MQKKWWKECIAYQIYPRSFMDSNGDGIGDLRGILSKLDYLAELGVDLLWISPIYESPNDDNGYDISDYKAIASEFGTMEDFDTLLNEAHARGMKIIMDLVINHTSDEHAWFIESRSSKDNPYRDYYIWHQGNKGKVPNNWESIFGGSAWELDEKTAEYYLHVFSKKQPDLNWENLRMRKDIYKMVNWWLDKGIDGFRVDAISHIKKEPTFADLPNPKGLKYVPSYASHMNQPGIHAHLQELKENTFDHYDIVTVGEANGVHAKDAAEWVGEDEGKFNMVFQFEHLDLWGKETNKGVDILKLKKTLSRWQEELHGNGWNALFMENHDQPRSVSSWGDEENYPLHSATAIATMYFLMQGTPFIYQGQEIGMTNVAFPSITDYDDIRMRQLYHYEKEAGTSEAEIMEIIWQTSRDNARTPMQWNAEENGGFTTGKPWLKVNPNYQDIHVEAAQKDPDSIFHYYKKLIALRKKYETLVYGDYQIIMPYHPDIYAYTRTLGDETIFVIVNFFGKQSEFSLGRTIKLDTAELLLANYKTVNGKSMQPYEARVYLL